MYEVSIFNNNVEIIIQSTSSDKNSPHIGSLPLKEGLSAIDSLSFILYKNNPGYDNIFELTTKIKVIDIRDDTTRFVGRILDITEKMDSVGLIYKEVLCESALSFLNDSKQRANTFVTTNPTDFLTQILAIHNNKVNIAKQIFVGNVDVVGSVAYSCDFKSTLIEIQAVKDKLGGDIRVREELGILYLDWLQSFSIATIDITLGTNMKDMIKGKNVTSLGTRVIPLGANNLTISDVNNGVDYIEDTVAFAIYGAIEKTVEYRDITDATELYNTCLKDLNKYTQPLLLLEAGAIDLSFLTGNKAEQFALGVNLHLDNPVMAIDSVAKVVQMDLDLMKAYDPKLTIANFPLKLSSAISDLRSSTVQNNGVYNSVQIGDAFGIRAVRSDNKVVTTINATEGISIENENKKVFYVDENGFLRAVDGIFDNITANGGTFNDIIANNGTFNDIVANEMRTSNTTNYMIFHDQYTDYYHLGVLRMKVGFDGINNCPSIRLYGEEGNEEVGSITAGSSSASLAGAWTVESGSNFNVYGNTNLATNSDIANVNQYIDDQISSMWQACVNTFVSQ